MLAGHEERGCGSLLGPAHGTDCPGASARALCGSRGGAATREVGEVQRCKGEKPQMVVGLFSTSPQQSLGRKLGPLRLCNCFCTKRRKKKGENYI